MAGFEEIDIPPEAYEPKPWFKDRPGMAIVREIKEFVAKTGKPYLWRGHTHTKPPEGAPVEYRGEFDLPASCKPQSKWSPCPCCAPRHPKYRDGGKIAWFPDEAVIRLIGPDCFRTLNPEGHELALAGLRAEQQREKDTNYLLGNLPLASEAKRAVELAVPAGVALDNFRTDLTTKLKSTLRLDLWKHLRDGQLRVRATRTEMRRGRDGSERMVEVEHLDTFSGIDGYRLLDPKLKRFKTRLETTAKNLQSICFADPEAAVHEMSDPQRRETAQALGRNFDKARRTFDELEEARLFLSPATVAALRGWGAHTGCPIAFYAERSGNNFYFGARKDEKLRVEIDPAFYTVLPYLPRIGATSL